MPQQKTLFARITKVDAATRTVTGIAMQEVVDRTREKCLYEESKPYFEAWSATQHKASGGKSKGNVREMHVPSAVGIVTELVCDDAQKAFVITSEVVDDAAWAKVEKGVYTGYSIGANFAKDANGKAIKSLVNGVLEWVADPVELSLVDIPCVPTALFEYKDAAGHVEQRKFSSIERRKSMYTVSEFASLLSSINYMLSDMDYELQWEGDGSKVPDRVREWLNDGVDLFQDVVTEETSEFAQRFTTAKAAVAADRQKALTGCGCDCAACANCGAKQKAAQPHKEEETMTPEQTKAFNEGLEVMKSSAAAMTAATEKFAATETKVAEIGTKVESIEVQMKSFQEFTEAFADFEKAIGEQPAASKTASPAAVAARDGEQAKAIAEPAAKKALTDSFGDGAERVKGFAAIYAAGGAPGFGNPA